MYPGILVELDIVAVELTGGIINTWVSDSLPAAKLSMKYGILHKTVFKELVALYT